MFTWYTTTFHCFVILKFSVVSHLNRKAVALHLRWLTTKEFKNYETVKGSCIPSKNTFKTPKSNKLRWLISDINFKLLHTGESGR